MTTATEEFASLPAAQRQAIIEEAKHQGRIAFAEGQVRVVPSDLLVAHGAEAARAWYRGWDAANLATVDPWCSHDDRTQDDDFCSTCLYCGQRFDGEGIPFA